MSGPAHAETEVSVVVPADRAASRSPASPASPASASAAYRAPDGGATGAAGRDDALAIALARAVMARTPETIATAHSLDSQRVGEARLPRRVLQRAPKIDPTDAAMGKHVVNKLNRLNVGHSAKKGVHYAHNYQANAQGYKAGDPSTHHLKPYADFWKEDYWNGYADPEYFKRVDNMTWELKPSKSAAGAIKRWLAGLTIAECLSALVAIELETIRAAIGDQRFDEQFAEIPSRKPNPKPKKGLLRISADGSMASAAAFMESTATSLNPAAAGPPGSRSVKKGEWYYFYNHPMYLLKHPGGAFQGENAICMDDAPGRQKWAGMGVDSVTEGAMLDEMAGAYNNTRDERDFEVLLRSYAPAAPKASNETFEAVYLRNIAHVPDEYREDRHVFPATVTANDILTAPPYTLDGTTRRGGFQADVGKKLSPAAVKAAQKRG